jgi:hypothetical protein
MVRTLFEVKEMNFARRFNSRVGTGGGQRLVVSTLRFAFCSALCAASSFGQWAAYGPDPRDQHTAVFDSATDEMIVFGGTNLGSTNYNDVWLAINAITDTCTPCELQWTFLSPSGTPPAPRSGHSAVYDSANSRMVVFGGALGFPAPCTNDVWVLDDANGSGGSSNWTQLSPSGTPPAPRTGHAAAYDPSTNRMIIFGGSDCSGGYLQDVWVLTNANGLGGGPAWIQISPSGNPPAGRGWMSVAYNSSLNSLVIYGGTNGTELSDVWVLTGANGNAGAAAWDLSSPRETAPAPRYGQASAYDAADDVLMVYGGYTAQGVVGDAWTLTQAIANEKPTWTLLAPGNHSGPPYYLHTAIYDPASEELVTFGGIGGSSATPTSADNFMFLLTEASGR